MYSVPGDTTSLAPGFPIRTSSDPRSVDSSPRHIAASHVLHRLPVPRHPPCALTHLHTKLFFTKRNCITTHQTHQPPQKRGGRHTRCEMLATTIHKSNTTPHHQNLGRQPNPYLRFPHSGRRDSGPVASKPNSVSGNPSRPAPQGGAPSTDQRLLCTDRTPTTGSGTDLPTANPSHM
jgi:hypothetical protein